MRRLSEPPHVTVFTDGACSGNPGPGGWGAILRFGDKEKELKGGEAHTTNNRMELMAAISALEALKKPCVVDLTTDSQYVRQGITGWIHGWKKNGWRTADKKPVKNVELWQRLDAALKPHQVRWHWIKGHAGHAENERADQLAREGVAMARLQERVGSRRLFPSPLVGEGGSIAQGAIETGEGFSPQTQTACAETDPSSGSLRLPPSPTRGEGRKCRSSQLTAAPAAYRRRRPRPCRAPARG